MKPIDTPHRPQTGAPEAPGAGRAEPTPALPRWLTPRLLAALAALTLGIGAALGAAIGPAPGTSLAGGTLVPSLLRSLLARSQAGAAAAPAAANEPVVSPRRRRRRHLATPPPAAAQSTSSGAEATLAPSPSTLPPAPSTGGRSRPTTRGTSPSPVNRVWLIELWGEGFAGVLAAPTAAPYIATQAIPAGALLRGWSALGGSAFAADAALLDTGATQALTTIVQPSCPAAGSCAAGTPGSLSAADAFLAQTVPAITATPDYRDGGLIVVMFASVAPAASAGTPPGAAGATIGSEPPGGVLLISPFATAGAQPSTAFNPASPARSVHALLRR